MLQLLNDQKQHATKQKANRQHLIAASDRIVLHTPLAESLFYGTWMPGKMGLVQFAVMAAKLCEANKADDPYAEWFLLKIDKAIFLARQKFKEIEYLCQSKLDSLRSMEIGLFKSNHPAKFPLNFSNPFSYMAAYLIVDVDYLARMKLTLERRGLVLPEGIDFLGIKNTLQSIFTMPMKWQNTKVTRKDILENTSMAQNACELLGELPSAALNREVEFSFSSENKQKSYESEWLF